MLAAAGTLAFVVATKDPGVAVGVTAGSAVLAASAAAWPSSARGKKSSDDPHEVTKKSSSASPPTAPLPPYRSIAFGSLTEFAVHRSGLALAVRPAGSKGPPPRTMRGVRVRCL